MAACTSQDEFDLVKGVLELLTPPENWTQGTFGRVTPMSPGTYVDGHQLNTFCSCWCIRGAARVVNYRNDYPFGNPDAKLAKILGFENEHFMHVWNDAKTTTHQMVLERLELALVV